jgi:hypothetical protein
MSEEMETAAYNFYRCVISGEVDVVLVCVYFGVGLCWGGAVLKSVRWRNMTGDGDSCVTSTGVCVGGGGSAVGGCWVCALP